MTGLGEGGRAMLAEATGRYHAAMGELRDVPWRQGRTNPRNLYADTGGDWKGHPPIGAMDSPELAREVVEAHNVRLERGDAPGEPLAELPAAFANRASFRGNKVMVTMNDAEMAVIEAEAARLGKPKAALLREAVLLRAAREGRITP